jgi:hypothetical protein
VIDLPQLYAACVVSYVRRNAGGEFKGPSYLLAKGTHSTFNLPYHEEFFSAAYAILEEHHVLRRHSHPGMMRYYIIDAKDFVSTFGPSSTYKHIRMYKIGAPVGGEEYKVLESYADLGDDWLNDALETFHDAIWEHVDSLPEPEEAGEAPASDRVVTYRDNETVIQEVDQSLAAIEVELKASNEAGEALGDLREVAIAEITDLRGVLRKPAIRAHALFSRARETLNWLIKRCAETSVSELAKHAMKLFIGWLS